jgi:hypothetical protein
LLNGNKLHALSELFVFLALQSGVITIGAKAQLVLVCIIFVAERRRVPVKYVFAARSAHN